MVLFLYKKIWKNALFCEEREFFRKYKNCLQKNLTITISIKN